MQRGFIFSGIKFLFTIALVTGALTFFVTTPLGSSIKETITQHALYDKVATLLDRSKDALSTTIKVANTERTLTALSTAIDEEAASPDSEHTPEVVEATEKIREQLEDLVIEQIAQEDAGLETDDLQEKIQRIGSQTIGQIERARELLPDTPEQKRLELEERIIKTLTQPEEHIACEQ